MTAPDGAGPDPVARGPRGPIVWFVAAAALLGAALAACPLPQPLPEVSRVDGGSVTPPRFLTDTASPADALVEVAASGCESAPVFTLGVDVVDDDTTERVDVRWFVDYATDQSNSVIRSREDLEGPADETQTIRKITPFTFKPLDFGAAVGTTHVVEVVMSNGFYPEGTEGLALPNRTAQAGFEVQVFRWSFRIVPDVASGGRCG